MSKKDNHLLINLDDYNDIVDRCVVAERDAEGQAQAAGCRVMG